MSSRRPRRCSVYSVRMYVCVYHIDASEGFEERPTNNFTHDAHIICNKICRIYYMQPIYRAIVVTVHSGKMMTSLRDAALKVMIHKICKNASEITEIHAIFRLNIFGRFRTTRDAWKIVCVGTYTRDIIIPCHARSATLTMSHGALLYYSKRKSSSVFHLTR